MQAEECCCGPLVTRRGAGKNKSMHRKAVKKSGGPGGAAQSDPVLQALGNWRPHWMRKSGSILYWTQKALPILSCTAVFAPGPTTMFIDTLDITHVTAQLFHRAQSNCLRMSPGSDWKAQTWDQRHTRVYTVYAHPVYWCSQCPRDITPNESLPANMLIHLES